MRDLGELLFGVWYERAEGNPVDAYLTLLNTDPPEVARRLRAAGEG